MKKPAVVCLLAITLLVVAVLLVQGRDDPQGIREGEEAKRGLRGGGGGGCNGPHCGGGWCHSDWDCRWRGQKCCRHRCVECCWDWHCGHRRVCHRNQCVRGPIVVPVGPPHHP
ncbi:hypothetical protein CBR_g50457 [Chara braunii]|uniref:Granulins domain-containing protein n=1 Tax=Chara braunii TaxID=69332 RepID=A0A388M723_CHABU|nr:hypothetical protein CBR_g50457 [Chara braunii]|eukprot:GBG90279.1 hypothetical protein CBR_g50457 [Chara braunii]